MKGNCFKLLLAIFVLVLALPASSCDLTKQEAKDDLLKGFPEAVKAKVKELAGDKKIEDAEVITKLGFKAYLVEWEEDDAEVEVFLDAKGMLLRRCIERELEKDEDEEAEEEENEAEENEAEDEDEDEEVIENLVIYPRNIKKSAVPAEILEVLESMIAQGDQLECEFFWADEKLIFNIEIVKPDKSEKSFQIVAGKKAFYPVLEEELALEDIPAEISKALKGKKVLEAEKISISDKSFYDIEVEIDNSIQIMRYSAEGKLLALIIEEQDSDKEDE